MIYYFSCIRIWSSSLLRI